MQPVKVLPGAYQLNNAEVPGVTELCNAFKAQYSSRLADQGSGGKTPGIRMGKTPLAGGRTPGGGRTPAPGGMSVRAGGATPAYGGPMGRTPIRPGMTPNPCKCRPFANVDLELTQGVDGQAQAGYAGGATPGYQGQGYPPHQGQQPYGDPRAPGYVRPPPAGPQGYGMGGAPPAAGMNPERA